MNSVQLDQLPIPTRRFITRLIADIPEFEKYSARYGHDAARKKFRSVKVASRHHCTA